MNHVIKGHFVKGIINGPLGAIGSKSVCRLKDPEFDLGSVTCFCGD